MATNIAITTFDNCAVLYLMDGTTFVVDPNSEHFLQLADLGLVTVSEAVSPEDGEHPPPDEAFIKKMYEFWKALWDQLKEEVEEAREPEVRSALGATMLSLVSLLFGFCSPSTIAGLIISVIVNTID